MPPSAGFQPFTGTNATVKSIAGTPDLNSDLYTAPVGSTVEMMEFVSFDIARNREGADLICSANPSDSEGNLVRRRLRGGILKNKVSLEGVYNGNSASGANTDARFQLGAIIKLDLIYHEMNGYGIYSIVGDVVSVSSGTRKEGKPATVKIEIEVDGAVPAPSYPA